MELTPELLTDEVQFRTTFRRGYDCQQVDAFLERVASAVELLQRRLAEATTAADDFAQRRADLEAAADRDRRALEDEIDGLRRQRDVMRDDVALLDRHLSARRQAMLGTLSDLRHLLEDPDRLRVGDPEGLSAGVQVENAPTGSSEDPPGAAPATGLAADAEGPGQGGAQADDAGGDAVPVTVPPHLAVDGEWAAQDAGFEDAEGRREAWAPTWADVDAEEIDAPEGDDGPASRLQWRFDVAADEEPATTGRGRDTAASVGDAERWEHFEDDLAAEGSEHPDFWKAVGDHGGRAGRTDARPDVDDEDAFLAELRQAMADGDGVEAHGGEHGVGGGPGAHDDEQGRERRGFGRRR